MMHSGASALAQESAATGEAPACAKQPRAQELWYECVRIRIVEEYGDAAAPESAGPIGSQQAVLPASSGWILPVLGIVMGGMITGSFAGATAQGRRCDSNPRVRCGRVLSATQ